jgi:hypothetical protein
MQSLGSEYGETIIGGASGFSAGMRKFEMVIFRQICVSLRNLVRGRPRQREHGAGSLPLQYGLSMLIQFGNADKKCR